MFEPFQTVTGIVAPIDQPDVDTDQIIPKQFLKRVEKTGYGDVLFYDWATDEDGNPDPDFLLNREPYNEAKMILARQNFGCGSSREHAVWALKDFGIKALIAPIFADIFRTNCHKNGLLPIELDEEIIDELFQRANEHVPYQLTVSLDDETIEGSDGFKINFSSDSFRRKCLLEGLDDIELTLKEEDTIQTYEKQEQKFWQVPAGAPNTKGERTDD